MSSRVRCTADPAYPIHRCNCHYVERGLFSRTRKAHCADCAPPESELSATDVSSSPNDQPSEHNGAENDS